MLKILQNEKIINGLMIAGFGLLAIGIALNFQNKKTEKTEIKIESSVKRAVTEIKTEVLVEPTKEEFKEEQTHRSVPTQKNTIKINLNTAGITELDALTGVGPAIAQRIIDYRKEKNGFMNVEEIKLVKGIGDKMYEKIKDKIEI